MTAADIPPEVAQERHDEWWAEPVQVHELTVKRYGTWGESSVGCTCGFKASAGSEKAARALGEEHLDEVLPECPNVDEPVLCKVHDGLFIPEAGCPRHDPNEVE